MKIQKMCFPHYLSGFALAALLASPLIVSCGKKDPEPAAPAAVAPLPPPPAPILPPPPPPAPAPLPPYSNVQGVNPFADSIDGFRFSFEPVSRHALLTLDFFNLDRPYGTDPYQPLPLTLTQGQELEGQVDAQGVAVLTNPSLPGLSARIKCSNPTCLEIEFDIERRDGPRPGRVLIRQRAVLDVRVYAQASDGWNRHYIAAQIARELRDGSLLATLFTRDVVGGRRKFFELQLTNEHTGYLPDSATWGRERMIIISGAEGPASPVWINRGVRRGRWIQENFESQLAKVRVDLHAQRVFVRFREDRGLRSLSIGGILGAPGTGYPRYDESGWEPEGDYWSWDSRPLL